MTTRTRTPEILWSELLREETSTSQQRRSLYRLGKSRWWVHKFATTQTEAHRAIRIAMEERRLIEEGRSRGRSAAEVG